MSGQMRFFHPFLKRNNVSTNDDTTKEEEQDEDSSGGLLWISGRKTTSNSTAPAEEVIPYSQSYLDRPLVLHEDDATATQMESKKDKEETKTLVEWKRTYKRILMKYLARRISESDGSILDDTSNGRLQRQQQENYFPLKSRIEIMYYACKFGFFPRESFRLDDDDEEEEEEKKKNRKFNGNRKDVHPVLLSNHDKNHSSGSGDLSLVETSDVLGTQTFHLEQTTMNVSLTHGLHQRTDDTHQNRQDGIQPQSYESSFIVPCIKDLPSSANTVSDIHLMVSNVSIPLASVVNMWRFHRFVEHREETHCSQYSAQEEDDEDIDNEPLVKPFPREWLDLRGPVFTNYTSVVSFEIMECHEDIFEGYFERVRILSKAVFGQKTRRIRLFFYDSYAEAIENILQWAEQCMRKKKQTKNGTLLVRDRVLFKERVMISLKNVPAQCIFPYYRQDYQSRVHGKPLELEYGLLSDYCICIGGDGCIINQVSGDLKRPLRFDSEQLEVRFVIKRHGSALDEFVLNRKSLNEWNEKGTLKVFKTRGESGSSHTIELCKKLIHTKDKQKNTGEGSNDETDNRHFSNPDRKRKSSASHDRYIPFSELDKFYMKHANNRRKDREIDICAAVLNVGVPRLTKRNWMMNLTVFDASLQYPSWAGNETNIPQVRLVIFSNSVENFPQIDCAGDVIVGQRILVDKYEGELQLTAFAWSKFTICRPCKEVLALYHAHDGDNEPRHPTSSDDDWIITQQHSSSSIDIELIADIWKFSQKRMSNHPNVQPKYKITLADVEQMCIDHKEGDANNSGDLTVMVCNIIPYPRKEQSLSSPKGVLRIWDGTGQPCSDPLPEGVTVNPEWSMRAEPNEQDLMLLSKIVERTKKEKYETIPQELANSRIPLEELEAPKCLCGRVTNVIIWESQHWALIQRFLSSATSEMGKFVRFRNAVIKAETVPTLHVNVNTTITPIPVSTFEIKALLLKHFLRTELNHPLNPRCALLPLSLSERIRGIHPQMDSKRFAKDGFSRLIDCISTPPLTPIKVLFYILGTKQDLKTKCLQDICVTNGKMVKYQLVLHVCDSHLDMFLNVPEVVAKNMLGISASDLIKKNKDEAVSKAAYRRLCRFTSSRQIFEGTVMSVIINQHKFFVLTECPTLELNVLIP